jgi:glutamine cyclotransferase
VELDAVVAREGASASGDVLNGIATSGDVDGSDDHGSDDETLLVTGKNWEHLYRIDAGPLDGS